MPKVNDTDVAQLQHTLEGLAKKDIVRVKHPVTLFGKEYFVKIWEKDCDLYDMDGDLKSKNRG